MKCNNCSSDRSSIFLKNILSWETGETFNITRCQKCKLLYLNPRPFKKNISKYYPNLDYWETQVKAETAFGYLYNLISSKVAKGNILDIGAGSGHFLSEFKKNNWNVFGVEFSNDAVRMAKKKYSILLNKGDFLENNFPKKYFDIVTLNNVLEHLYQPKETLLKINDVLKEGGTLLITVPNLDGIGFKLFKKVWYPLDVPRHLYHFTPSVLKKMVINSGYDSVTVHYGFWYHDFPALFESFRRAYSPRIKMVNASNLTRSRVLKDNGYYEFFKNIVVILSKMLFGLLAYLEPLLNTGEVFTLEAVKNSK